MKYVTRVERFVAGDYPLVCVRSGRPATKMVPVQARRSTVWPYLLFPGIGFVMAKIFADRPDRWGLLPFAEGEVGGVTVTYERSIGIIINGAHPRFIEATRVAQGRATF